MRNVTAYIGRDCGGFEHSTKHVVGVVLDHLTTAGVPGATFSDALGYWEGELEHSIRVELIGCDVDAVHAALTGVCVELMQWSILYVIDGRENVMIENDPTEARATHVA